VNPVPAPVIVIGQKLYHKPDSWGCSFKRGRYPRDGECKGHKVYAVTHEWGYTYVKLSPKATWKVHDVRSFILAYLPPGAVAERHTVRP
jgi:hypothetical protein